MFSFFNPIKKKQTKTAKMTVWGFEITVPFCLCLGSSSSFDFTVCIYTCTLATYKLMQIDLYLFQQEMGQPRNILGLSTSAPKYITGLN